MKTEVMGYLEVAVLLQDVLFVLGVSTQFLKERLNHYHGVRSASCPSKEDERREPGLMLLMLRGFAAEERNFNILDVRSHPKDLFRCFPLGVWSGFIFRP